MITELDQEEMNKAINEYMESNNFVVGSFDSNIFNSGIIKTIDEKMVRQWFSNPEDNLNNLEKFSTYQYIANSAIFQLYDLVITLPNLNYQISALEKDNNYDKNAKKIKKILKKVKHKPLTRDILSQTISCGTLCGIWAGTKKNPYLYIFDNLEYIFPAYRKNGNWVIWIDLKWLDTMTDLQREETYKNLHPYIDEECYKSYKEDSQKYRFVELPIDKTICIQTHTLYRNQRFGLPWNTQSIFDILHKEKLKALEKTVSNKVINSVAVLQLGSSKDDKFDDSKIPKGKKQKVYRGVKAGLQKNETTGVTVLGIPHWAYLDFPEQKTDGLNPNKFESINDDINSSTNGVMNVISGKNNYSVGKLNLDIIYRKIAVLLEDIEEEVYQKLINWILPNIEESNYSLMYDKSTPLTTKEKVNILSKLNSSFGFSLKSIIDNIEGVDFEQYIDDSIYEQEKLKLPQRIKPYQNAYVQTGKDSGSPSIDDPTNQSTLVSKDNDGNNNPKPST